MAFLSDEHHAILREKSGLSDEVIQVRGYRTVPKDELAQLALADKYDSAALRASGAMAFNVMRPDGQVHCEVLRLNEVVSDRKYLWPSNVRNALDVYPGHIKFIKDISIPLVITEGSKKVDAIVSHLEEEDEYCVIGINGCWGWRARIDGGAGKISIASPDFHDIALDGRKIIYIPDSDYLTNSNVKRGWDGCGEYLASKTKPNKLHVCVVPPKGLNKQGADDYLLEHKFNDLLSLCRSVDVKFEEAKPPLDWITMDEIVKEETNISWLVSGFLPMGGIGLLVGHTRSYKTWLAMRMCLDLIRGRSVWDHPSLQVSEPVNVLYINMEMVRAMIKERMEDFLMHGDIHSEEMDGLLAEHFFVLDNKTFDLRNEDHVTWLVEHIRADKVKFGVIDTLSMVWQGDENSASDIGAFYKTLRSISELTGITWLVLHHMAKPSKERGSHGRMFEIRGSGQILQQADTALGVEVLTEGEEEVEIRLEHFKSRSAAELADWTNVFSRPTDTKARNISYKGPYSAPAKPSSKAVQDEATVVSFVQQQEGAFEQGIKVSQLIAMANTEPELQTLGSNKLLKLLQMHVNSNILQYNKNTQTYTKGEQYSAISTSES